MRGRPPGAPSFAKGSVAPADNSFDTESPTSEISGLPAAARPPGHSVLVTDTSVSPRISFRPAQPSILTGAPAGTCRAPPRKRLPVKRGGRRRGPQSSNPARLSNGLGIPLWTLWADPRAATRPREFAGIADLGGLRVSRSLVSTTRTLPTAPPATSAGSKKATSARFPLTQTSQPSVPARTPVECGRSRCRPHVLPDRGGTPHEPCAKAPTLRSTRTRPA